MSTSTELSTPEGPGSVSGAPNLPAGFTDTFTSRYVDTGDVRLHAVIGGDGPPLLLVHGWPETWYAWRLVMPALARDFPVIAVDQRGIGLSDKPQDGYDTGTLAADLVALMDALGHERFAVVGHDTGFAISYALAADHPDRVDRVALAEIPGPAGDAASPPVFVPGFVNDKLWHIPFNRVETLPEQLITGREDVYFGYEFAIQGGTLPAEVIAYYVEPASPTPTPCAAASGSTGRFDATLAQNDERTSRPLPMPVLAIGGSGSYGEHVGEAMAAARRRRAERGHPRCRPLGRRAGARRVADGTDDVPGPVPRRSVGDASEPLGASRSGRCGDRREPSAACRSSPGRPGGSTPSHSVPPSCVARSCSSTSGRSRASTGCVPSRTSARGREAYRDDGLVVVGVHTPEFSFEHEHRPRPPGDRRRGGSTIRSRSTTTTRSGAPSTTTTGRRSTSSTPTASSATITSARDGTRSPNASSSGCSA